MHFLVYLGTPTTNLSSKHQANPFYTLTQNHFINFPAIIPCFLQKARWVNGEPPCILLGVRVGLSFFPEQMMDWIHPFS